MKYAVEIGSGGMMYIPSFMTISSGIQVILTFCLSSLICCNVGNTDDRDL
jgi:hypothetical protein